MARQYLLLWGGVTVLTAVSQAALAQQPPGRTVTVAQDGSGDFNGGDEKPIIEAIAALGDAGGRIAIKPGTYLIRAKIVPRSGITIGGSSQAILKLPSPVLTTAEAAKGATSLAAADTSAFAPGTLVQVCPPQGTETFPDAEAKQLSVTISQVEDRSLVLSDPLTCAIPENSRVGYSNNVFEIRKPEKGVTIENLVIDGGRMADIPMPGHVERCALLAHGSYSYEGGPTGPPIEELRVINCHIRNCYGRAVAMYQVIKSEVRGCLIEDIADEAIDFDHFVYHSRAVGNEVRNAVTGVTINDGSYCTVEYNRFTGCGVGVTIWWWHMCPQEDIDIENVIRHNFIFSPKGAGISVGKRCFRNQIVGNFVEGKIDIAEPNNIVEHNTITEP
jgi:hypothetical protein